MFIYFLSLAYTYWQGLFSPLIGCRVPNYYCKTTDTRKMELNKIANEKFDKYMVHKTSFLLPSVAWSRPCLKLFPTYGSKSAGLLVGFSTCYITAYIELLLNILYHTYQCYIT